MHDIIQFSFLKTFKVLNLLLIEPLKIWTGNGKREKGNVMQQMARDGINRCCKDATSVSGVPAVPAELSGYPVLSMFLIICVCMHTCLALVSDCPDTLLDVAQITECMSTHTLFAAKKKGKKSNDSWNRGTFFSLDIIIRKSKSYSK